MELADPTMTRALAAGRIVVFTDLDGTLLDHETYEWHAAQSALAELKRRRIPVVLSTSKTLAELAEIRAALGLRHPVVAENGCFIDVPEHYFKAPFVARMPAVPRARLQQVLGAVRGELGFDCVSFHELGETGIAAHTGLSIAEARLANRRSATEPLLWRDSQARLSEFEAAVARYGLHCLRGGRFVHLMGPCDKASAMLNLLAAYRAEAGVDELVSIALGDSPNDLGMLRAADVAVVIPGRHDQPMPLDTHPNVLRPRAAGPAGWQAAMQQLLGFE